MNVSKIRAAKLSAVCLSILGALAGFWHGFFEMLQGNISPESIRIASIGPSQRFWEHGREPALTIIPNFMITGILAMVISLLIIVWAIAFIDKKYGLWGLILLSVMLLLFGGGFAPPTYMILAIIAAVRLNKPLKWRYGQFSHKLKNFLARLWPGSLIIMVILTLFAIEAGIFGFPLTLFLTSRDTLTFMRIFGYSTFFGIGPVVILSAFAYDSGRENT